MLMNKNIQVTGGTGSLGKVLTRRLLSVVMRHRIKNIFFLWDKAKQHEMPTSYRNLKSPMDEIIYNNSQRLLQFRIGDICDFQSISFNNFIGKEDLVKTLAKIDFVVYRNIRLNGELLR